MTKSLIIIYFIAFMFALTCCKPNSAYFIFNKVEVKNTYEIDTLEKYHNDSLLIVRVVENGSFGRFSTRIGYYRIFGDKKVLYIAGNFDEFRISKKNISEIDPTFYAKVNWGWFSVSEASLFQPLPNFKQIIDSVKRSYGTNVHVSYEETGSIVVYVDGKIVKELNYADFLPNAPMIRNLDEGLYKMQNNGLILVSSKVGNILSYGKGIYYVPQPGLGVIKKFNKNVADSIFMAIKSLETAPDNVCVPSFGPRL